MYVPGAPDMGLVDLADMTLETILSSQRETKVQSIFFFPCSVCEIVNMLLTRPFDYMAVGKRHSPTVPWYQG